MKDSHKQLVVRLKYDPSSGRKMRRYCYQRHVFRAGPDWTPVSDEVAEHLRGVRTNPSNANSQPAFEVMTQAEANELLEAERAQQRPRLPGDNQPVVGGSTEPISPAQALQNLIARMRRGDELSEEEEGLVALLGQTIIPSHPSPAPEPSATPQAKEGRSLLDDDDDVDPKAPNNKKGKGKGKRK